MTLSVKSFVVVVAFLFIFTGYQSQQIVEGSETEHSKTDVTKAESYSAGYPESGKKEIFSFEIDEELLEDLKDLALRTNLSPQSVCLEILDFVLGSGKHEQAILAPFMLKEGEGAPQCSGDCKGKYTATREVAGNCSDPCDTKILDDLEKEAEKEARLDAIKKCQESGGRDCICAGGTYSTRRRRCRQLKPDKCLYDVKVRYVNGTCQSIP